MLASSGMAVICGAAGEAGEGVARLAGGVVEVGVMVGFKVGSGVGAGVGVGVVVGAKVGSGIGVGVGVKVGAGVGVGVGTGLTDGLQLSVRKPMSTRENARKQPLKFRFIAKTPFKIRSKLLYL